MEPLQQDDPRQFGPYATLARLWESASSVRYLAAGTDGTAVMVSAARPPLAAVPAFRRRFQAEARTAERLAGGWVPEPLGSGADEELWTASAYVPALTLRESIALVGPLPERAVRILGAALAETLSRVHATGAVLHGLAPDTVLLAADGPRLTAFGALGAAAVAHAGPGGQLSVQLGYLTPEQSTGAEPGPASDIFVLGLLLAYAATGTTPLGSADGIAHGEPELGGVPAELRPLVASCLSKLPQDRPSASTTAAALALEGAAALARDGWLPPRLLKAVESQAEAVESLRVSGPGAMREPGRPAGNAGIAARVAGQRPVDAVARQHAAGAGAEPAQATSHSRQPTPVDSAATMDAMAALHAAGAEPAQATSRSNWPPPGGGAGDAVAGSRPGGEAASLGVVVPQQAAGAGVAGRVAGPDPFGGSVSVPNETPGHRMTAALAVPAARSAPPMPQALPVPAYAPAPTPGPAPAKPDRRALLAGIAAGVAGIALGGGGVYAVTDGESEVAPKARPAPRRARVAGMPPEPAWRYEQPGKEGDAPPSATVWRDRVLLLTGGDQAVGVDLRTGRRLWQLKEAASLSRAVPVDDALCLVNGATHFLWISALDGQIRHRVAKTTLAGPGETLTLGSVTGSDAGTLWVTGHVKKGAALATYFFAYDLIARKWLWRTPVANGLPPHIPRYDLIAVRPADIVVRQDAASLTPAQRTASKGASVLLAFDRKTGKLRQSLPLPGVVPAAAVLGDTTERLFAAAAGELQAYNSRTGARLWRLAPAIPAAGQSGIFPYGKGTLRGPVLYVANRYQQVYAIDTATGRRQWQRSTEAPVWNGVPATALSASGGTVLAGDGAQLTAFAARDGRRLWKFQEAGVKDVPGGPRYVPLPGGDGRNLVVQRERTFYALPVD
ncbi:PQQ-binding-like beta-propeller repeat protein [Streptomyces maoxianensis]|uniref:PQQ-binding-like beta-propeller repeat protein n=1 Tax=Streptomyces maoxianensis TaxID=1459942 RepID=A0ABV9G4N9_9ACTN